MSISRRDVVKLSCAFGGVALTTAAGRGLAGEPRAEEAPADEGPLETWWADLEKGVEDASRALLKLADRPNDAVAFLKRKMKPLRIDAERVKMLLDWLESDQEEVWKAAFEELEYFDPRLAIDLPDLMTTVTDAPARQRMVEVMSGRPAGSLEGKQVVLRSIGQGDGFNFSAQPGGSWWAEHRIERINSTSWGNLKKKWTRAVRALVLLEHIGTPDAIALLKDMATGHPDAEPTRVAVAALERIGGQVH